MLLSLIVIPQNTYERMIAEIALPTSIVFPVIFVLLALLLFVSGSIERPGICRERQAQYENLFNNYHTSCSSSIRKTPHRRRQSGGGGFLRWSEGMKSMRIVQICTSAPAACKAILQRNMQNIQNYYSLQHLRPPANRSTSRCTRPGRIRQSAFLFLIVHDISARTRRKGL
jgi:hypothetical protein